MKLPSLRNLKRIEALVGIAWRTICIVLIFAPLPLATHGPISASTSASVLTGGAAWEAA